MNLILNKLTPALLLCMLLSGHRASAFYDPGVQRWINRDPLGDHLRLASYAGIGRIPFERFQGGNLYWSSFNNPVNWRDRDGLIPDGPFIPPPKGYNPRRWPPSICPTPCETALIGLVYTAAAGTTICTVAPLSQACFAALAETAVLTAVVQKCVADGALLPGL